MPSRLDDYPEPDSLRHVYPSCRVPRVALGEAALPVRVPRSVACIDTTLGAGLAALRPATVEQRLEILALLEELNAGIGLIRRAELRLSDAADREVLQAALARHLDSPCSIEPTVSLPGRLEALESVRGVPLREVGLRWSISDLLLVVGEHSNRRGAVADALALLDAALDAGHRPRLELIDFCRADIEGFLLPALEACLAHLAARGAPPLRVRLCDSFGLGLPWSESPLPRSLPRLLHRLRQALGLLPENVELETHDDLGLALPNAIAGVMHGCSAVVGSLGGVGQRAGLAPTELLLVHLGGLYGVDSDLSVVGQLFGALDPLGLRLAARHPLWGEDALSNTRDVPRELLESTPELGAPFHTPRVLGRTPR
jgi:citrate (Re)-synthase